MMRYPVFLLLLLSSLAAQTPRKAPAATFQISGTVVNATSGQPLSRTRVGLTPVSGGHSPAPIITGSDGRFAFSNLAAGKYALSALRPGFPPQSFNQHEFFSTAIAVGPDLKSTGLTFRLQPEAVISGTVRDEADEPIRDATVMLFHRAFENGRLTVHRIKNEQTDDQGGYRFGQLPAGSMLIAVQARPWYAQTSQMWNNGQPVSPNADLDVAYPLTFYPGVTDSDSAAPVEVHPGDQLSADFVLRALPSARLNIQKTDADPRRPFSASLMQRLFDSTEYIPTQNIWRDNMFSISGFAPGNYIVQLNTNLGEQRNLEVSISGESTIDADTFPAKPTSKVSGILRVAGYSGPLNKAVLQIEQENPRQAQQSVVSADGTFDMNPVPAGTYEFRLFNLPDTFLQTVNGPGAQGRFIRLTGTDVSVQVLAVKGAGNVTGTVLNGDTPLAGAMVMLVPEHISEDLSLLRRDQSDSDGTFTLSDVAPGSYTLLAIIDGWDLNWSNPQILAPYLQNGQSVTITRGLKLNFKIQAQKK